MPTAARARARGGVTWSDYVALPEHDRRELVDGELMEVEAPSKWHESLVMLLGFHLTGWARGRRLVVLASGYKVRIAPHRAAMPDLQMLKESVYRDAENDEGLVRGRPELVVEIISPS